MFEAARETNLTAASRTGTTLTANASPHTEAAAWTELIASTDGESQGFYVRITGVNLGANETNLLLDIAYGDVAGGNEVQLVQDYAIGGASAVAGAVGRIIEFPQVIPTTKSVSARIRGTTASDECVIAIALKQGCEHLEDVGVGTTYGISTVTSRGTSVPCGSGDFGVWTELPATSGDHNLFMPSLDQLGDTSIETSDVMLQLGYGATAPGSGGTAIEGYWVFPTTTAELIDGPFPPRPMYADVASGTKLWARLASNATENRGVSIIGMEGTAPAGGGGGTAPLFRGS